MAFYATYKELKYWNTNAIHVPFVTFYATYKELKFVLHKISGMGILLFLRYL